MNENTRHSHSEETRKDIVLFYYYSSPSLPKKCFLGLLEDIAYRNMFLLNCGNRIHFEFPMFEDHSYNSICNLQGGKSLIKRPQEHDKYMIFRTKNADTGECTIIGYYKVGKVYYQETDVFNSNGFVWGIEAEEAHLIKKNLIVLRERVGRMYWTSWRNKQRSEKLNEILERIKKEKNISEKYKKETNRLVNLFKDKKKIDEWKKQCQECDSKNGCILHRRFKRYAHNNPKSDMFSAIHRVYTETIYSRNILNGLPREYILNEG